MFKLFPKPRFVRTAHKLTKNDPALNSRLKKVLEALRDDPSAPSLKPHKLKGKLNGLYACSLTHDLRIVFKPESDIIHLIDIGSHDEVY